MMKVLSSICICLSLLSTASSFSILSRLTSIRIGENGNYHDSRRCHRPTMTTTIKATTSQQNNVLHDTNEIERFNNIDNTNTGVVINKDFYISSIRKAIIITVLGCLSVFVNPVHIITDHGQQSVTAVQMANADDGARVVGQLKGSGLVFKDTLQIESFEDPKVRGVQLYISTFQIPITERFGKNMFSDPSYASVACARTGGPVAIASNIAKGLGGEEVFEEKKSLLFKDLRVFRVYDEKANTVVYVSFNTRLDKGDDTNKSRFKSSLCAVNLDDNVSSSSNNIPETSTPVTET